ncbi:MAG: co-chaperone DjlA [Gammaproteobacteria bacterium]|nr:co-chaperone DjlA [Gammaproteobacteria bacterium]
MSWWGKILGGAFGFMLGGPLGAVLGAALGHGFDRGLSQAAQPFQSVKADKERIQQAFFAATFSVMGHIAKADGRVSEIEISMANQVMSQMLLDAEQREVARRLFDEGKQADFDLQGILKQFRQECHRRFHLIQMFLEIQIATLLADGVIHRNERNIIHEIARQLGVSERVIDQLISMVQGQQYYAHTDNPRKPVTERDLREAYAVLGLEQSASDEEVKKAYRRLMNQHHPDKLVSKGLPEEMTKLATAKTQEIKRAYEQIKRRRKSA